MSNQNLEPLDSFEDTENTLVFRGDTIAYAVDNYGSTRLKIGVVMDIYRDPDAWEWYQLKIKVKVPGQRVSILERPSNTVLLRRGKTDV